MSGSAALAAACSATFLGSCAAVIVTPGPDAVLVTQLLRRHRRRGPALAAAAGMLTAGAGHAALAVTGVAALLVAVPALLTVLRVAGAALLLWWGARAVHGALRRQGATAAADAAPGPAAGTGRCYLLGLASTGSNPKVGLFLLAFLPQFVPPGVAPAPAMTLLAGVYLTMGAIWLSVLIESGHRLGRWLERRRSVQAGPQASAPRAARILDAVVGVVFIALAARLLLAP